MSTIGMGQRGQRCSPLACKLQPLHQLSGWACVLHGFIFRKWAWHMQQHLQQHACRALMTVEQAPVHAAGRQGLLPVTVTVLGLSR